MQQFQDIQRNRNFEISVNDIHIEAEIGEGAFGRVYRAKAINLKYVRKDELVAVKQLKSKLAVNFTNKIFY